MPLKADRTKPSKCNSLTSCTAQLLYLAHGFISENVKLHKKFHLVSRLFFRVPDFKSMIITHIHLQIVRYLESLIGCFDIMSRSILVTHNLHRKIDDTS